VPSWAYDHRDEFNREAVEISEAAREQKSENQQAELERQRKMREQAEAASAASKLKQLTIRVKPGDIELAKKQCVAPGRTVSDLDEISASPRARGRAAAHRGLRHSITGATAVRTSAETRVKGSDVVEADLDGQPDRDRLIALARGLEAPLGDGVYGALVDILIDRTNHVHMDRKAMGADDQTDQDHSRDAKSLLAGIGLGADLMGDFGGRNAVAKIEDRFFLVFAVAVGGLGVCALGL
jgi:hypothetical protein